MGRIENADEAALRLEMAAHIDELASAVGAYNSARRRFLLAKRAALGIAPKIPLEAAEGWISSSEEELLDAPNMVLVDRDGYPPYVLCSHDPINLPPRRQGPNGAIDAYRWVRRDGVRTR